MSKDEEKQETPQQKLFSHVNRVYRAASRLQYTILHSQTVSYDDAEKIEELLDNLHEAALSCDSAIECLRDMEEWY